MYSDAVHAVAFAHFLGEPRLQLRTEEAAGRRCERTRRHHGWPAIAGIGISKMVNKSAGK